MNEENLMNEYSQRVQRIETQVAVMVVEQSNLRTIVDKQNAILEALVKSANITEYQTKAFLDRSDKHSEEIERIASDQVDIGKVLEAMKVQLNILKAVGGILLSLIAAYIFSVFIK